MHLLSDILMIGLCTYLTGGTDYVDMHLFAKERGSELGDMLLLPNGAPSDDTFRRVFERIKPEELEHCLTSYGKSILDDLSEKQLVIDGKKQCGTSPTSRGNKGLYILNAWVSENCFCIAQKKVEDKSNEITAIPEILSDIDIENAVVSIDAMGTQRDIAGLRLQDEPRDGRFRRGGCRPWPYRDTQMQHTSGQRLSDGRDAGSLEGAFHHNQDRSRA